MDTMFDPIEEGIQLAKDVIDICSMMDVLEQSCDDPIVKLAIKATHEKIHLVSASSIEYLKIIGDMMFSNKYPNETPNRDN